MQYLLLALSVMWLLYKKWTSVYSYWESKGFPCIGGSFPFGTTIEASLTRKFVGHIIDEMYWKGKGHPYVGTFEVRMPNLLLRDPQIIKLVLAKGFSHFRDRSSLEVPESDHLSQNLFSLEGERWRALRVKLSPTFTSGKLKAMFPLFVKCAEPVPGGILLGNMESRTDCEDREADQRCVARRGVISQRLDLQRAEPGGVPHQPRGYKYLLPLLQDSQNQALDSVLLEKMESAVDVKDISARFGTDVICSCAFGLEVDSVRNENSEFRTIGGSILKINKLMVFIFYFINIYPDIMRYTKISAVPKLVEDFIMKVIRETVDCREKNEVKRDDFLELLIQLKNKGALADDTTDPEDDRHGHSFELTLELLAAQCFFFFLAGFETSSSVQTFCLYELARNLEIQERLHKEIEETITKHGELSYRAIQEMEYLDMVISETMRKYPTLPLLTRRCTKSFTLPEGHRLVKGDRILIPVWSLHHDPEYFPDPDTFDPERFSPKNRETIKPFTYLPFGEGPRNCIGMRFGLLQTKVGLITVLRKYRVSPTERTPKELTFLGRIIFTLPKEPVILNITKRAP